jgi:hypothetical protein
MTGTVDREARKVNWQEFWLFLVKVVDPVFAETR